LQTKPFQHTHTKEWDLEWDDGLPDLLKDFKARPLVKLQDLLTAPAKQANFANDSSFVQDEYYIIHSEGYKYTAEFGKGKGHNHRLHTGFSNNERGAIFEGVMAHLNGILIPNEPLMADIKMPTRSPKLSCLYSREILTGKPTVGGPLLHDAIKRSAPNGTLRIALIYANSQRISLIDEQLTALLGLDKNTLSESNTVQIQHILLTDLTLLSPLEAPKGLPMKDLRDTFRKAHNQKRDDWRAFLAAALEKQPFDYALIDLGDEKSTKVWNTTQRKVRGAVREACIALGIRSQFMHSVSATKPQDSDKEELLPKDKGRVLNALSDLIIRQNGLLFGSPAALYARAELPASLAQQTDVVALYHHRTTTLYGDVDYALAVRLTPTGQCYVQLHDQPKWIPYSDTAKQLGNHFIGARKNELFLRNGGQKVGSSNIKLTPGQFASFAARVVTSLEQPTILVVEAEYWRNARSGAIWPQLTNDKLSQTTNCIDFRHVPNVKRMIQRTDDDMVNLLGIVRMRMNAETPQYVPLSVKSPGKDFTSLSGFCETVSGGLLHYFSIGQIPVTLKDQNRKGVYVLTKFDRLSNAKDPKYDVYGSTIAFKHQQVVELVPFFIRDDLVSSTGQRILCRIPHLLRFSPAWDTGNTLLPYPMHLAKCLIEDYLCVLGVDA
jgi:hypothetical protein